MKVLALDLATVSGWAVGVPGDKDPLFGSIRFAKPGGSHEAIAAGAIGWAQDMIEKHEPTTIIYEAPIPASFVAGRTNIDGTSILFGLPFLIGGIAHRKRIFDVRKASVRDVRVFFIGENLKRVAAKRATIDKCLRLGWNAQNDNEADALAIWLYQCAIFRPELAVTSSPLFMRRLSQ